ncbi:MAG TPA: hypothetical protein VG297_17620 [Bryobacteraceae bacterium]|jgi:hypothetical protein|nr:hypothetical protein [Bryobacteraceae bacterium]
MLNLLSFETDLWGRPRPATEASRANLLRTEENRKAEVVTLVSGVASDYAAGAKGCKKASQCVMRAEPAEFRSLSQ